MSDDPELKPLRQQARERNEHQERMKEREEQRYNSNGGANRRMDQKKDDKQNNLYMMKDSFKGELYNEEDFDHFSYFNSLREKQLAIERQDTSDLQAFKTVVTIEEKNKPEVNLSKQTEAATAIKLSRKVVVKPKQLIEASQAKVNVEQQQNLIDFKQELLSGKRERTLSQELDVNLEKGNQPEKKLKKDAETQGIVPSTESETSKAPNEVQQDQDNSIKQSGNSKNIHTIDNNSKNSSTKEQAKNGKLAAVLGYSSSSDSE